MLRPIAAASGYVFAVAWRMVATSPFNKAIELLEQNQPIYYTGGHGGFDEGVKLGQTWADYINYDMEHAPFNVSALAEFMRGLVKGGPTKSGHRTPAVIVTLPTDGSDEVTMRANAWMVKQVLATGIHGILLCHADSPGAVKAFVEAVRFPTSRLGGGEGVAGQGVLLQIAERGGRYLGMERTTNLPQAALELISAMRAPLQP